MIDRIDKVPGLAFLRRPECPIVTKVKHPCLNFILIPIYYEKGF